MRQRHFAWRREILNELKISSRCTLNTPCRAYYGWPKIIFVLTLFKTLNWIVASRISSRNCCGNHSRSNEISNCVCFYNDTIIKTKLFLLKTINKWCRLNKKPLDVTKPPRHWSFTAVCLRQCKHLNDPSSSFLRVFFFLSSVVSSLFFFFFFFVAIRGKFFNRT